MAATVAIAVNQAPLRKRNNMPYCKLCDKYLERHPEHLTPSNSSGDALNRLLEVREIGGLGDTVHVTLPGRLLHERAALESGIVLPPRSQP